ncbi:hypothetical protein BURMUCF1_1940, partial [Burkholderia multivorans ATCC BAA-247]
MIAVPALRVAHGRRRKKGAPDGAGARRSKRPAGRAAG